MAWNPAECQPSGGGIRVSLCCHLVKRDRMCIICHTNLSTLGVKRGSPSNYAGPAGKAGTPGTTPAPQLHPHVDADPRLGVSWGWLRLACVLSRCLQKPKKKN